MKVKICGITNIDEINVLNRLKPDYIGFVFAESIRRVTKKEAEILYRFVHEDIKVVGVFKNNSREFIEDILKSTPLYAIQLHGNEDRNFISYFKEKYDCKVWKGASIESEGDFKRLLNLPVDTLILDSKVPGSGERFNWEYLNNIKCENDIFLAGGINEYNIEKALEIKNIQGIDVSSGVESLIKGIRRKDPIKMDKLIRKVREKDER